MSVAREVELTETALSVEAQLTNGRTGATALVAIREADTTNSWLDFDDNTFKTAGWTTRQEAMPQVSAGLSPGLYRLPVDITAMIPARVAGDELIAEVDVSATGPDLQIFGTDRFLLVTELHDVASAANVSTAESNIRGGDSRDLTNLAGAGWVAADNLVQAHNKLDGIQSDIDNFENITRFKVSGLSAGLERPEPTNTTLHEIYFNLKDDQGLPVDADGGGGGTVTVEATSFGGIAGNRDGRLSSTIMTNLAIGRYRVTFSVADTDILEGIHFFFSWAEGGNANNVDKVSHVLDSNEVGYLASDRTRDDAISVQTTSLDGTKITTARATNLDNITAVRLAELDAANLPLDLDNIKGTGFVTGTDSLEALRDRGDAAWATATGFAVAGDQMALTSAARALVAEAVRDVNLAAAASGSLGEGIIVAKNSKLAYRVDNYDRDTNTGFAKTARIRIFASQAAASASTSGAADGVDGELEKATLTGTPHGTFVVLPIDIVTGT